MKIKIENSNSSRKKTEMLCGFVLEDSDKILGLNKISSMITASIKQSRKDINGEMGKITIVPTNNKTPAKRILLAGIGKKRKNNKRYNKICFRQNRSKSQRTKTKGIYHNCPSKLCN